MVFPVRAGSPEGVRGMAQGDAGVLAVCDAALPDVATPVDQRAAARAWAVVRTTPPAPIAALFPPSRWTRTPRAAVAAARPRGARSTRCRARAVPRHRRGVRRGGARREASRSCDGRPHGERHHRVDPERFATCAEADRPVNVHVLPDASSSREAMPMGCGGPGTPTVDLAGHRAGHAANFQFRAMPLAEFAARVVASGETRRDEERRKKGGSVRSYPPVVAEGETYYLRSVADAKKARTHVARAFPSLASDLRPGALLPPLDDANVRPTDAQENTNLTNLETPYPRRAYHSSVLRVASRNVALWTHYDTHDNVLAQIAGRKTVTLWPPDCEPFMHCEGSSSRVADIAAELDTDSTDSTNSTRDPRLVERRRRRDAAHPRFAAVSKARRVATLRPGEALHIPALWFHHARRAKKKKAAQKKETRNGASVAVNVPSESPERTTTRDVFGNKDPPAARRAADMAAKAGAVGVLAGTAEAVLRAARPPNGWRSSSGTRWNCQPEWRRRSPRERLSWRAR